MLDRFSDIACMTENSMLTELSLDGNPLANNPDYRKMIIHRMKNLTVLDTRPLTVCYGLHYHALALHSIGGGQDADCSCGPRGSTRTTKS